MPEALYLHQIDAITKMRDGCILCGGTGSGKSRTALGYYFNTNGGVYGDDEYFEPIDDLTARDLYIITTARKRDTLEWDADMIPFGLATDPEECNYNIKVVVDSWNNIAKYRKVAGAFFIFDEQRVTGSGPWVKSFLDIARKNRWILLSATPGDRWTDYIPVFVANGFYKNKTEFVCRHVTYKPYSKFHEIDEDRYLDEGRLIAFRNKILVKMNYEKPTSSTYIDISVDYDRKKYKEIMKNRWNVYENEPVASASELCYVLRRAVNSDIDRIVKLKPIIEQRNRVIIFYNYDYELNILKKMCETNQYTYAEWNGHRHEPVPDGEKWVYLVNYAAGAEGWNCILTNTLIFFSLNYSYKTMLQAAGRIDRLNSPYKELLYYRFRSTSPIDLAIMRALRNKKRFNEQVWLRDFD